MRLPPEEIKRRRYLDAEGVAYCAVCGLDVEDRVQRGHRLSIWCADEEDFYCCWEHLAQDAAEIAAEPS